MTLPTERLGRFSFRRSTRMLMPLFLPSLPLIIAIASTESAVRLGLVHSFLIPAPSSVARALYEDRLEFSDAFFATGLAALTALALSFVFGTFVSIALSTSRFFRRMFYPYAIFFQTVPVISIAPLLVIWFGFGQPTVIASAFIVSIFPIIANTLVGLEATDRALVDLFRLYQSRPLDILWKLRLPFALPYVFSGLRIASGLAVIGAIVGEFIAGTGLGEVIDGARTQQRVDKVFAAVLLSSILGLVTVSLIELIGRRFLKIWQES